MILFAWKKARSRRYPAESLCLANDNFTQPTCKPTRKPNAVKHHQPHPIQKWTDDQSFSPYTCSLMPANPCFKLAHGLLALATSGDDSSANLQLIMLSLGLLTLLALLAGAVVLTARRRAHRQFDLLTGALILWIVLTGWSALSYAQARSSWSKDRLIRLESGYAPDAATLDAEAPAAPITLWGCLAIAYVLLAAWALVPRNPNDETRMMNQ
jgi:hypothetical protein